MNLKYFTREAYTSLKKDLAANKDKYYSEEKWLYSYFEDQGIKEFYKESSIIVKDINLVFSGDTDTQKNADDLENVKRLFTAFGDKITPATASDPLMWAALCHMDYRDYILKRWRKDDGSVRLDQRFFATEGRASLTYYNALSRLWWSGYLTYDETAPDPWELTATLLSAQQIQKDLFDQSFSMSREVVKGLLRALKRIQAEKKNACTPLFRKCCDSFFNHYGAVTAVDVLTADEIEQIAYDYMKEETEAEKKRAENKTIKLMDKQPARKKIGSKKRKRKK